MLEGGSYSALSIVEKDVYRREGLAGDDGITVIVDFAGQHKL